MYSNREEKAASEAVRIEDAEKSERNLVYDDAEQEPELHLRTYVAVAAMFLLNFVQVFALTGPPVVLNDIGAAVNGSKSQTWIPNAFSLVQAVLCPAISSSSDTFQARKVILVVTCTISFVGAAIAPQSTSIARIISAQVLIGFGFAAVPLAYCVPSEILPRRWRPFVQAGMNVAASLGACSAPLIIGGLTRVNPHDGWRNFYWIQMGIWGATALGIFFGYTPPTRHTRLDGMSFWQKLGQLDILGYTLLTAGLTLFLVALNLGGGLYAWTSARVLATLIIGLAVLLAFGVYEWKGTNTGILHHEMFQGGKNRGRTFGICVLLIFLEGVLLFSYIIFYPTLTTSLFETDTFLLATRIIPFWVACGLSTVPYGYASTRLRSIRAPMFVGFVIFTSGIVGLATIEPDQSTNAIVFSGLAGLGFGAPLVIVIAGAQLSTPHHLIATATALTTSARAVAATVFTAIYAAALNSRLDKYIPQYVAEAATNAGLPSKSLPPFIEALTASNQAALLKVPGATPAIIQASVEALKQAFADGIRVVYIIAAPFGLVACAACFFLGDLKDTMNYRVDAPVEDLHAKNHHA